jgi:phosphatidylglycerophosphate synthase
MIDGKYRDKSQKFFDSTAFIFIKLHISPKTITILAFLTGAACGIAIAMKAFFVAFLLLWVSGYLDTMDGTVARKIKKATSSGMYMDLTLDRMVEACIILGFAIAYPEHYIACMFFLISALFNFTTFMITGIIYKNCGKKGMHYDIGIIERTEAFIFFGLMIIATSNFYVILTIFNILIFLTGIMRFKRIIKELEKEEKELTQE